MTYEELLDLRERLLALVAERRRVGDYDANAASIREALEAVLAVTQHLVDRSRPKGSNP